MDIVSEFPEAVLKKQKIVRKDMEGRLDLRDEIIFTIDGADARTWMMLFTSSLGRWEL